MPNFDLASQEKTPILTQLKQLAETPDAAFYAPGHKRGQGISQPLKKLLGKGVFQADLPELPELDNLFAPQGVIKEAQDLAAAAFGADQTWFLVNGSTGGIMAAILATCGTGDKVILPRNCHQSAIAALILSGAIPIFINPEYDPIFDLPLCVTPEAVEAALKEHSDIKAVMIIYPTYHGICGDIEAIATITHSYHIPLLVDEAHGAHLAFHSDLPPSALSVGADLTVQSTHKLLGAMTQASMLHLKGDRISPERISTALQLLQSTSPSYLLLASLDAARQQVALQGQELLTLTMNLANEARNRIRAISGLSVLEPMATSQPGYSRLDLTRLTVKVTELGISGFEADDILHEQLGVTAELPMLHHLTFIISIGNTQRDINELVEGFNTLTQLRPSSSQAAAHLPFIDDIPPSASLKLSPREAFFATTQSVSLEKAIAQASAELICPYPPGIPVILPGEEITERAIAYLQQVLRLGGKITGCSDPTLKTLKIAL